MPDHDVAWKKWLNALNPHLEDGANLMVAIFLWLALLIFIVHGLMAMAHPYPLDYGEAPLVDQAMRLAKGQNIYRRDLGTPPFTISNYPPLYVVALTPFVALFGPSFFYGRLLSFLCTVASAVFLGLTVYAHTQRRAVARLTAMLFLAIPYVVEWSAFLRVDMLALALSTAALWLVSKYPASKRKVTWAAVLLVAATYTRQSYGLAAPMAAFIWLWTQQRAQAWRLFIVVAGTGLSLLLILTLLTGGGFVFNIFTANVNPFELDTVQHYWQRLRETMPILLIMGSGCLFLVSRARLDNGHARLDNGHARLDNGHARLDNGRVESDESGAQPDGARAKLAGMRAWPLVAPYLVGGLISAFTIGKVGSNVNYLLELCAALSLAVGLLMDWSATAWRLAAPDDRKATTPPWWLTLRSVGIVLLAIQVALLLRGTLRSPVESLKWRLKPTKQLEYLDWLVANTEGPILADEFMGFLTLNDKVLYLQPFELTQLANADLWDQTPLLESIREQQFSYIMIHHFMGWPVYQTRWTPEMLSTIFTHYAPDEMVAETLVFVPRDEAAHGPANLAQCPDAPWPLPTQGELGMWWFSKQLLFLGAGFENTLPVYTVADGLLMRREDWNDAVAILHDDPVNPGEKVWAFYGDMANPWGDSFIVEDFPPGSEALPVKQGQVLGYQGTVWEQGTIWTHARFAILPMLPDGSFPGALIGRALPEDAPLPYEIDQQGVLDPSPYLGMVRSPVMGEPVWLPPRCQTSE